MSLTLMPFAQLPGEVLMDPRLKPTHIRVLIALYMHSNKKRELIWPKRKTLSKLTGIHEATISRLTTELENFGWVTKEGNAGGCGRPASYRVHVPDHVTSKFDTQVDDNGDIVTPETVADSTTVAKPATVANLKQNRSGINYPTLAESTRGKEHTKNRPEQTNVKTSATAPAFVLPDWIDRQHWDAWHSCAKRKNVTDAQKQMAVDKLAKWRAEGVDHAAALENAAIAGWQGLFRPDAPASAMTPGRRTPTPENFAGRTYVGGKL